MFWLKILEFESVHILHLNLNLLAGDWIGFNKLNHIASNKYGLQN